MWRGPWAAACRVQELQVVWAFLRFIAAIATALLIGLGSAYFATMSLSGDNIVRNGPWSTNLATGGTNADDYTRTFVAVTGLLALNKDETIYYGANNDSAGEPLDGRCTYRIEGSDPDARWWSVTLYGRDHYLIPNPARRYSLGKTNVTRSAEGTFVIRLSTVEEQTNWIATSPDGFQITLRLYNPGQSIRDNPASAPLPSIVKETCI